MLEALNVGKSTGQRVRVPLNMQLCGLKAHFHIHMSRWVHSALSDPFQFEVSIILLALTEFSYLSAPMTNDLDVLCGSQNRN